LLPASNEESDAVIVALAESSVRDRPELRPLQAVVDPDAVDALFQRHAGSTLAVECHGVTVRGNDEVLVRDAGRSRESAAAGGRTPQSETLTRLTEMWRYDTLTGRFPLTRRTADASSSAVS